MILAGALLAVSAQSAATEQPCADAMVVARIERATPTEIPRIPGEFVMRWPWVVELDVEQVLIGPIRSGPIEIRADLHSEFNPQLDHVLLFLQRRDDGRYWMTWFEWRIVRDRHGRFVIPLAEPLHPHHLAPHGAIPASYAASLRPVRYRGADAWWLRPPHLDRNELNALDPAWARRSGRAAYAVRGLFLEDLAALVRRQPGALCADDG
jgi:hypothetical protein